MENIPCKVDSKALVKNLSESFPEHFKFMYSFIYEFDNHDSAEIKC